MAKWKVYYRKTSVVAVTLEANSRIEAMDLGMNATDYVEEIIVPSKRKEFMSAEMIEDGS